MNEAVATRAATVARPLVVELVRRARSIASGTQGTRRGSLPPELSTRIARSELRSTSLASVAGGCEAARRTATMEFTAEAVAALILEKRSPAGEARSLVDDTAAVAGISPDAAVVDVFLRVISMRDAEQLPPRLAADFLLNVLAELTPADAASLWTMGPAGRLECIASAGDAPLSRRMRAAARALLEGDPEESAHINAVAVQRWDRPFAALVVRARPEAALNLSVYIRETAAALSPHLEREMLFERNAVRERSLVSAAERRVVRLGCDLHDGPLQELVAFAEDLRLARDQVGSLLEGGDGARVRGRFDDLAARLASLDEGLRDIAHAVRSTSSVERPLEHALRQEVDGLTRTTGIEAVLDVDGDVADLTASQKIALLRVVQESLSNVRKHSGATSVQVRIRATSSYVTAVVTDNGRGFDLEEARRSGRLGLTGVVERVRLLGGDVEIDGRTGEGVDVRVTLPRWRPAVEPATPLYAVTV